MKKNTVAFLTRSLVDATGISMWHGIVDSCKKEKVPVITFRGPDLNHGNESIIYRLFNDETFGGLISWASSDVTKDVSDYYQQFKNTPLVCVTFKVEGKPVIFADCKAGMSELMDHLIDFHGFTKIAFIRGPALHVYANERYEAYLESLKKHGIEKDDRLISPNGGWGLNDGMTAVKNFIQSGLIPGRDMEAIVCVGDNVAIGAQEYLIKQGYQVPHDIAVCGFNGTDDAAWCNPPITTVEMPFHGIGVKAFSTLMDKISGRPTQEEFRYSTSLVLGESCGCKSLSVKKATLLAALTDEKSKSKKKVPLKCLFSGNGSDKAEIAESELKDEKWQKRTRKMVLEDIESTTSSEDSTLEFFKENAPRLIQLYAESVVSLDSENTEFIIEFGKTLNKFLCISTKFRLWQDFLSVLSMNSQAIISSTVFESVSASILQQARILIHEFDSRQQKQKSLWDLRYDADLRNTSADLLSSYNISELMDILHKSLKKLKIPGVYVVLYENCEYTPKNNKIPQKSRLVLAVRDNERLNLKKDGFEFDTEKIIPDQFLPQSNFYSLVLESLNFQDKFIGYIVFQEGPRTGGPYTAIRDQLSSSLYGALLLGELNENKDSVESAMRNMSNKADLVATHSKSISGSINTISNSMESVTENIRNISDNIMTVSETVSAASQMIDEANLSITNLVSSTERISQAITMINDISETINVLALNASIEASHAGDAGKGFSVVAKEVKVLAAKTMSTTEMIFELVTKNNKNTQAAKKVMLQTASSIKKISELSESIQNSVKDQVNSTSTVSSQIANASSGTTEISKAIDEIAEIGSSFKSKDDEKSATI